jgi:hypothetical protein
MIRRLFELLFISVVVIGGSSIRSASPERAAHDHVTWVSHTLEKMEIIKPGMTRWDLLKVFRTEGGISTGLRQTFVSQDCPYFKVDVEFKSGAGPDKPGVVILPQDNRDIIVKVSKPYLQSQLRIE